MGKGGNVCMKIEVCVCEDIFNPTQIADTCSENSGLLILYSKLVSKMCRVTLKKECDCKDDLKLFTIMISRSNCVFSFMSSCNGNCKIIRQRKKQVFSCFTYWYLSHTHVYITCVLSKAGHFPTFFNRSFRSIPFVP